MKISWLILLFCLPLLARVKTSGVNTVTSTELGYISGVTSAIQTQLNGKQASGSYLTSTKGSTTCNGTTEVVVSTASVASGSTVVLTPFRTSGTPVSMIFLSSQTAGVSFGFKCGLLDTTTVVKWAVIN